MKNIKILGAGCPKCKKLAEQVAKAAGELNLDCNIEKVSDIQEIMSYGVMMTPALVVEGVVKSTGAVPNIGQLKELISEEG